jgi:hypothetical protein
MRLGRGLAYYPEWRRQRGYGVIKGEDTGRGDATRPERLKEPNGKIDRTVKGVRAERIRRASPGPPASREGGG